ncbi:MAG: tRNA (5-methylaminomethyl-2-thiouridine)(34)-methyltransferase MnmD [Bacteroidales bacterium]
MKEKNKDIRNTTISCPSKDGFFVAGPAASPPGSLSVEVTADGSPTVRGPYGETYHSMSGALLESAYVYRDCGLQYFVDKHTASGTLPSSIHILEAGLGTGLNALLACQTVSALPAPVHLFYSAIEKYPLQKSVTDFLEYPAQAHEKNVFHTIHSCPWRIPYDLNNRFTLLKYPCDILEYDSCAAAVRSGAAGSVPEKIHVVFYDLFSPAVQPELWTEKALQGIIPHLASGAVLTTYSCTGSFRRLLDKLGFKTERLPGPGAKRCILRAVFI